MIISWGKWHCMPWTAHQEQFQFSILLKVTSTGSWVSWGFKPATFCLLDDLLYFLSYSCHWSSFYNIAKLLQEFYRWLCMVLSMLTSVWSRVPLYIVAKLYVVLYMLMCCCQVGFTFHILQLTLVFSSHNGRVIKPTGITYNTTSSQLCQNIWPIMLHVLQ